MDSRTVLRQQIVRFEREIGEHDRTAQAPPGGFVLWKAQRDSLAAQLANLRQELVVAEREFRTVVWVMHPLKGDVEGNIARAKRWLRWLVRTFPGIDFAADWILWCEVLNDADPIERERGLRFCGEMIRRLDECWMVGGTVSDGMKRERAVALDARKVVRDLTHLGLEPPVDGVAYAVIEEAREEV